MLFYLKQQSTYKLLQFTFIVALMCPFFSFAGDPGDTTSRSKISRGIPKDSADKISEYLLNNNPIFIDHWNNDMAFVYEDVKFEDIPQTLTIPLIREDEQFNMTWYGRINSTYKWRWGRQHHGLDIHLQTGDAVIAAFDGVVRYAQYNKNGYGFCVVIRHLNGLETLYAHLSKILVDPNQFVKSGELVGLGGNTGHSQGPHLHFETRYKDFSFDPEYYIDVNTQQLKSDTLVLQKMDFTAYRYKSDKSSMASLQDQHSNTSSDSGTIILDDVDISEDQSYATNTKGIVNKRNLSNKTSAKTTLNKKVVAKKINTKNKSNTKTKTIAKKNAPVQKQTPSASSVKKTVKKGNIYEIKAGDNLSVIAKKTGVPVAKLRKMNKIKSDLRLMPGQKLRIQ